MQFQTCQIISTHHSKEQIKKIQNRFETKLNKGFPFFKMKIKNKTKLYRLVAGKSFIDINNI